MPEGCCAPFLMPNSSKQAFTEGRNVYFRRIGVTSVTRQKQILGFILQDCPSSCAVLGLPRVGKTCELNYYTIKLFQEMGRKETRLKVLLLRIGVSIYNCKYDKDLKRMKVTEHYCQNIQELNSQCDYFFSKYNYGEVILVLDLVEDEIDPKINLPFITSLSSRDVNTVLKSTDKAKAIKYFLYDLPSNNEIEAMVRAYYASMVNNIVLKEQPEASIEEILKTVRARCDIIG
jgi:hypothetical protein